MSTAESPGLSSPIVNLVHEIASHHVGKGLLDIIRNSFTGGKIRSGDYYFSRTRTMIQQHYPGLPFNDQNAIHFEFAKVLGVQEELEDAHGTVLQRYARARKYKRISKNTFKIVERASNRAVNNNLMAQFSDALGEGGGPQPLPGPTGTTSTHTDPFGDAHAVPTLTDIDIGNVNQMEMTTFESETTGEAAVILELHGRDGSTQEVVATFPLELRAGNRADEGAETRTVSSIDTAGHGFLGPPSGAGDDDDAGS